MKNLLILIIACLLISCSNQTTTPKAVLSATPGDEFCDAVEIEEFRTQALILLQQYYDQVLVTRSTPTNSMSDQIAVLQEIKADVESLIANPCTAELQSALMHAIDSSINGFSALLAGEAKSVQQAFFDEGTQFIREVNLELVRLADCLPECKP